MALVGGAARGIGAAIAETMVDDGAKVVIGDVVEDSAPTRRIVSHMTLLGRDRECATIDAVLEGAREGRSGALLVGGPAGIGKSALLEYAARSAHDFQLVRAAGVESEMELQWGDLEPSSRMGPQWTCAGRAARFPD